MPRTLYLVRHGQTTWNEDGRIQGQTDIGLSQAGKQEAEELARWLERQSFDAVVASDLSRARETARLLVPGAEVQTLPELRELHFGQWEGRTLAEVRTADRANWSLWMRNPFEHAPPGGETLLQLADRIDRVLDAVHSFDGDKILLVTHQTPIQIILCRLLDLNPRNYWKLVVSTGSLTVVQLYGDVAALNLFNFRPLSLCQALELP